MEEFKLKRRKECNGLCPCCSIKHKDNFYLNRKFIKVLSERLDLTFFQTEMLEKILKKKSGGRWV